jgi:hypothetical protein
MKNRTLISAAVAAAMLVSTVSSSYAVYYCPPAKVFTPGHSGSSAPWFVIGCAGGIVLAALAANARDGRELTAEEAWTCGALFLASKPMHKKHKRHHRHG